MDNGTSIPGCAPEGPKEEESKIVIHIAMGMVTLLSVCGVLGNALAIFVFSRQKNKLSSTVFILTLAVTDFISSLVTMPYTVVIELMYYNIGYDFPCKLYQFMKTTTIPFSAFVMVAIALDRYLCIVYPFKHIMTVRRAKLIVCVLVMLAFVIGILASLMIGTYSYEDVKKNNCSTGADGNVLIYSDADGTSMHNGNTSFDLEEKKISNKLVNTGICMQNYLIFDLSFIGVYQRIYSALFGVCAILVIILYCLTYRSVLVHRNKRLNVSNKCCGMITSSMADDSHEHTEFTTLHKDDQSPIINGQERESCMQLQDKFRERCSTNESPAKSGNRQTKTDQEGQLGPGGVSRAKLKKLRVANIKTALMLSIVAFIYIVAFTPAWMMALKVLKMNVIVYYLYFTYNVANPVIYAFLNNNFRTHLQAMFRCRK
jgi:cholecystokinin A receptor/hypocretin (orexin) receptor 2